MGQGLETFLWLLIAIHVCHGATSGGMPKIPDKYDGSYYNGSRVSTGASNLNTIYAPKLHPYAHAPNPRSGIGIAKGPPDLQFGLAFTVPFVSLSTERLLNQVSQHRGYDSLSDLANVLKLNVGGLAVVAVVGIAALLFIPAILPKFGNMFGGGFGVPGGGGWTSNGFGGFFPGFLETLVPGLGLTKPLGYGQTYDVGAYPYNNDYYGSSSQRSEKDAKSRALKDDDPTKNGTGGNFWFSVLNQVRHTASEFQTCALYAMCERGRNVSSDISNDTGQSQSLPKGRVGRAQGMSHDSEDQQPVSQFEDIFGAMAKGFGDELPALIHMQKAFEAGKMGSDCSKYYKQCPYLRPIEDMVKNVGEYIFN